jgi:hypothetical protein
VTTGATALLLPAQNSHTLHDPIRDPEHARAGGVEDGLGVGGLDGGGDLGNVVREEAAGGCAALAVSRVVSDVGEARLTREEAEDGNERGCERAGGFGNECSILQVRQVISARLRPLRSPLLAFGAHLIGFRTVVCC